MDNELHAIDNSRRINVGIIGHHNRSDVSGLIRALDDMADNDSDFCKTIFISRGSSFDHPASFGEKNPRRRGQRNAHGRHWE